MQFIVAHLLYPWMLLREFFHNIFFAGSFLVIYLSCYYLFMEKNKIEVFEESRRTYLNLREQAYKNNWGTVEIIALNQNIQRLSMLILITRALDFGYGMGSHNAALGTVSSVDELYDQFMALPHDMPGL